jgi:hypothetical protein
MSPTELNVNVECVHFVWLDVRRESSGTLAGALRAINDCLRTYIDMNSCLQAIRANKNKIFVISSAINDEGLNVIHTCDNVEAILILDPSSNTCRTDLPKLIGTFTQQEELLRIVRATLDRFEQIQLESFSFETDKRYLWWQLWKDEVSCSHVRCRFIYNRYVLFEIVSHRSSNNAKQRLVELARNYYRSHPKRLKSIDEFDRTYRITDAIRCCFRSPFPLRPLRCALMSGNYEQIVPYQFLVADVARCFRQQSNVSNCGQFYRGMKLSGTTLDMFDRHCGQLVCTHGFFTCSKSRNIELQAAASPGYRPDLLSVLFKIDFDSTARFAEITLENGSILVVFDVATSFRVVCVNRGNMSIVKLKSATDDGKQLAVNYKTNENGKTIRMMLDELLLPVPKPHPLPVNIDVR